MRTQIIDIDQLIEYIDAALLSDHDLIQYFDRNAGVKTPEQCCSKIWGKIMESHPDAVLIGVLHGDKKIGYYVFKDNTLISFGLSPDYRNRLFTEQFWNCIKDEFTGTFQCALYSYNTRAIEWLRKCGMEVLFANISILQLCR